MRLKSRFTCTFTHTRCFYSGSTHLHTSIHFHLQIYPKLLYSYPGENSQKHYPIPVIPHEINARDILVTTTCCITPRGWVLWKKSEYEEIKRGKCPKPQKKRKSETRVKNRQVSKSRIRGTRYPPKRKLKENIEHLIPRKKLQSARKVCIPSKEQK